MVLEGGDELRFRVGGGYLEDCLRWVRGEDGGRGKTGYDCDFEGGVGEERCEDVGA